MHSIESNGTYWKLLEAHGFIPVGSNVDTSNNAARCDLTPTIRNHDMVVAPCSAEDRSQNGVNLSMP